MGEAGHGLHPWSPPLSPRRGAAPAEPAPKGTQAPAPADAAGPGPPARPGSSGCGWDIPWGRWVFSWGCLGPSVISGPGPGPISSPHAGPAGRACRDTCDCLQLTLPALCQDLKCRSPPYPLSAACGLAWFQGLPGGPCSGSLQPRWPHGWLCPLFRHPWLGTQHDGAPESPGGSPVCPPSFQGQRMACGVQLLTLWKPGLRLLISQLFLGRSRGCPAQHPGWRRWQWRVTEGRHTPGISCR